PYTTLFRSIGCRLEPQVELLALQFDELVGQLIVGLGAQVLELLPGHHSPPRCELSPRRATTLVLIGSFIAARLNASAASGPGTPSSSNRMRPGFTRAAQYSTAPLPLPWRTSAGFFETGTSGNTRIHRRPWRLMWRVIARRAASIWRAVIRSGSMALRPYEPKLSAVPPLALPWMRPLKALRNLVFFGCSMVLTQLSGPKINERDGRRRFVPPSSGGPAPSGRGRESRP